MTEENFLVRMVVPDLSSLACIIVSETSEFDNGYHESEATEKGWVSSVERHLSELGLGFPTVAYPVKDGCETGAQCMHAICHRNAAVKVFKAISCKSEVLRAKVTRNSVILRLPPSMLQTAVSNVILQSLLQAGWTALSPTRLVSEFLRTTVPPKVHIIPFIRKMTISICSSATPSWLETLMKGTSHLCVMVSGSNVLLQKEGRVHACDCADWHASVQPPNMILLTVQPGRMNRWNLFDSCTCMPTMVRLCR
jgi:hypothetical protein